MRMLGGCFFFNSVSFDYIYKDTQTAFKFAFFELISFIKYCYLAFQIIEVTSFLHIR